MEQVSQLGAPVRLRMRKSGRTLMHRLRLLDRALAQYEDFCERSRAGIR